MCGIAGIISPNPSLVSMQILKAMTNALAHRGPDGEGHWISPKANVALGHRRLAIIDLSPSAAQPMQLSATAFNGEKTEAPPIITYNGELYNYLELQNDLQKQGYRFTTQSDTEVVLAAFDFWGSDCVQHFDGMFAFAIWHEKEQQLFCARDRFGEKPFYFFIDENRFVFASEMKALWAAGVEKKTEGTQMLNYISLGLVQNAWRPLSTFFQNISTLPAAHTLILNAIDLQIKLQPYWDVDKQTIHQNITEKKATEQLLHLLQNSVQLRLRSHVAVGTSLSGGLDSSSIVSLISEQIKPANQLQTFSAVFPGFKKDESKYIHEVVQKFGVNNHQISPTAENLIDDFEKLLYHQEEPFQSLSIYAQFKVYELAKQQNIKVILDGQGADETLAGYHKYYHWYWQQLVANKQFGKAKNEINFAKKMGVNDAFGIKNFVAAFMPNFTAIQLQKKALKMQSNLSYLNKDFVVANTNKLSVSKPITRNLNDILYFNTIQLGLPELLRYADRNSMAHGAEVRLPFLNNELVQFIFSLPAELKIKEGWSKWILRNAMSERLPADIVWRKDKVGYEPPQQQWLQNKTMQEKIFAAREKLVQEKILNATILQKPIQAQPAHENGNHDFRILCAAGVL